MLVEKLHPTCYAVSNDCDQCLIVAQEPTFKPERPIAWVVQEGMDEVCSCFTLGDAIQTATERCKECKNVRR